MPPILEPTFVFELQAPPDANPGGRVVEPGVMFAGSPPMLYVAEPVWNATWGRWFSWHSPTIAASVFLATLLITVWWTRRVGKRPRQVGRMYCRVCNHQLAKPQLKLNEKKRAVWADAESKCPECGVRHKRGPVRGRLRFTRMLPVLLVSPVVLFVCGLVMLATLRFHQRSAWGHGTWPVAGMDKLFGSWALERRSSAMQVQSTRLWRIDPRTNVAEAIGPIDSWGHSFQEFVSPDGRFVVSPVEHGRRLLVVDLKGGERAMYPPEEESRSYFSVERFSIDGTRVFVEKTTFRDSGNLHELMGFEPATGKFETIASVELPPEVRTSGVYTTRSFEFRETPVGIVWVHESSDRNATGRGEETTLRWEASGKTMKRMETSASGSIQTELSEDAKAVVVTDYIAGATMRAFDLETGADLSTVPPIGISQERDRLGPRRIQFVKAGTAIVLSLKGETRSVAELPVSADGWPLGGTQDGRFACGWKERDVAPSWIGRMLGAASKKAPDVRIWDFEKLLDADREVPKGGGTTKISAP
ncbi:MAG: hypothetical protein JNK16_01420 [Phycisphaerales bacterium]|nr:hypothetical protein [Phycisphaerales bacterium]